MRVGFNHCLEVRDLILDHLNLVLDRVVGQLRLDSSEFFSILSSLSIGLLQLFSILATVLLVLTKL